MKEIPSKEALEANARLIEKRKTFKLIIADDKKNPIPESPATADANEFVERLRKVGEEAAAFRETITKQLGVEKYRACQTHKCELVPDVELSVRDSREAGQYIARFKPCPVCQRLKHGPEAWKLKLGIPAEFMDATLDNWKPQDEQEAECLMKVRAFVKRRSGFLILLGNRGRGKTHLSAAIIAHFRTGRMFTQADLLYRLRQRYSDNTAEDVITAAKSAKVLVIDEMGLSAGGKDEFPMLHEILSHRHSNYLPTVLNGNIMPGELAQIIGERMQDRLQQSLVYRIIFTGESNRKNLRANYQSA